MSYDRFYIAICFDQSGGIRNLGNLPIRVDAHPSNTVKY